MSGFKYRRKDTNHNEILEEMRKRGINCLDHSQEDVGYDILTCLRTAENNVRYVEIKSPEFMSEKAINNPNLRERYLTDSEKEMKKFCDLSGVPYLIVVSYEDFRKQIN